MMDIGARQINAKASLDALPSLLDSVEKELASVGLDKECSAPILLSIDEVFSNIVMHGQLAAPYDAIQLNLLQKDDWLCIDICDWGTAFDPTLPTASAMTDNAEKTLDDLEIGGWGLLIVTSLATDIQYTREDGMNRFMMRFPAPKPSADAEPSA